MEELLTDFKSRMNVTVFEKDIKYYSGGTTDSIVFSINDEYLIKKTSKSELDVFNVLNGTFFINVSEKNRDKT